MPASRRPFVLAAVATLIVAAARFFPAPALLDAATGAPAEGFRLAVPLAHLLLTPFATLGDLAVCSSVPQALELLLFLFALAGPFGWLALGRDRDELRQPLIALRVIGLWGALVWSVLAWGALWPRAPARIEADDQDLMAVDFHSHSSYSHDGRSWFTPAANLAWHRRAGFGAAFITDHNRVDGAREARRVGRVGWTPERGGAAPLWGEELSLHDAHVLLLGAEAAVDNEDYRGMEGLERFLRASRGTLGGLAVPSLPEYYEHHRGRLETLADWGAAGFEIVAASPRGLTVPPAFRLQVADLCRRRGLFVTGGSDNHGYGSTSCVASFVRIPGWRTLEPAALEREVLAALGRGGFGAVRVIARAHALQQPEPGSVAVALETPRALWRAARAWSAAQALAAVLWAWALAAVCALAGKKVI